MPSKRSLPTGEIKLRVLQDRTYVYEAAPSLKWIAVGLGSLASIVLLIGVAAEIRDLRGRQPLPRPG